MVEKENHEEEIKKYLNFVNNPDNFKNCKECPDSRPELLDVFIAGGDPNRLPCGQYTCWVRTGGEK